MHRRGGIELRRRNVLRLSVFGVALVLAAGCGEPADHEDRRAPVAPAATGGAEAPAALDAAEEATGAVRPAIRGMVGQPGLEPQVLRPIAYELERGVPVRVRLAELSLRGGAAYRPAVSPCQDVLLYVRRGELRAVGAGIAPPQAPATLYEGDAIRFGPEGDGLVQNLGTTTARTVVAFVRPESAGEPSMTDPGPGDCGAPTVDDPLVRPSRATSVRTTAPNEALDGKLRVRILLDADGAGARHGGLSVLEGDADLVVPQHRHPEAAEILFVEDGSGVMHIGSRAIRVRAGAAIYVPPGELHDFRGDGSRPLRAIQVYSPSGPEQRFRGG